jgi:hypothetical protein
MISLNSIIGKKIIAVNDKACNFMEIALEDGSVLELEVVLASSMGDLYGIQSTVKPPVVEPQTPTVPWH